MPKSHGRVLVPFLLLLISTNMVAQKSLVFGFIVRDEISRRPDPFRHLKSYDGTYNLGDKHYWASAAFTGIHGYAIAGIWLLIGLGFGSYMIFKYFHGSPTTPVVEYPPSSYILMFSLVVLFTILAIAASSVVLAANNGFEHRVERLRQTIFDAGGDTRHTIRRVIKVLLSMQTLLSPYNSQADKMLNVITHRLRRGSITIQQFVDKTRHVSNEAIRTLCVTNIVVVTVNLVLLVCALVLLVWHWPLGFIIIIFCCWILTTLSWVLTGFDFFFHTFAEDTCSALEDFQQNPQNNSLQIILPCASSESSDKILVQIGSTVHNFITQLNYKLREVQGFGLNDNGGNSVGTRGVCDPFSGAPSYSFTPDLCPKDTIPIAELKYVLSRVTCYGENSTGNCANEGRFIPQASSMILFAYTQSVEDLVEIFPDLQSLSHCSKVRQAFGNILQYQCRPFRRSAQILWSSMLSLSIIMVLLVLTLTVKAHQETGRSFDTCSITPKSS
ncbi:hypothetical protein T459_06614 [Capsicum annuum]|uniref:Transmembrane protein n=1 Tax=Capsicum annuum TaxID=4072 RepID=A0A2G3ABB7_CAPAN|nr:uncharacterized protein LOC107860184 [Capsicum annuum]PHT91501.1 hypothetical protein T459_06614 [Capsicum annuum]